MPYIITTTPRPTHDQLVARIDGVELPATRIAVATLGEARDEAAHQIEVITGGDPDYEEVYMDAQGCSELGDTFGLLPDGTVIEVRPASWSELAQSLPVGRRAYVTAPAYVHGYTDEILAAFNA